MVRAVDGGDAGAAVGVCGVGMALYAKDAREGGKAVSEVGLLGGASDDGVETSGKALSNTT